MSCEWSVPASNACKQTVNTIRSVVDQLQLTPNPEKSVIKLSIGDPTLDGVFKPPNHVSQLIGSRALDCHFNGYAHSCGIHEVRASIAKKHSLPNFKLTADDVVITSGCSGAIEIAMVALGNPGDTFLIPSPGFGLYETVALNRNFNVCHYPLIPEREWEVDLETTQQIIFDEAAEQRRVVAMVVINPSNPCGSVYSKQHLQQILQFAERNHLPVIADEMYGGLVFDHESPFYPIASLTNSVPVLSMGGIAKQYMCPGWRLGWILCYGPGNSLYQIKNGMIKLSQVILGANTLIQSIVPSLLEDTPKEYYDYVKTMLRTNRDICLENLRDVPGIEPTVPKGTFYLMLRIDTDLLNVRNDMDFTQKLVEQQSVFVLPGSCFKTANFVRLIFSTPPDVLREATLRIKEFCKANLRK